jgi:hypothetical protein
LNLKFLIMFLKIITEHNGEVVVVVECATITIGIHHAKIAMTGRTDQVVGMH